MSVLEKARYDQQVQLARSLLDDEAFAREWHAGQVMALEEDITYALDAVADAAA